jgi:hypothetical protein
MGLGDFKLGAEMWVTGSTPTPQSLAVTGGWLVYFWGPDKKVISDIQPESSDS